MGPTPSSFKVNWKKTENSLDEEKRQQIFAYMLNRTCDIQLGQCLIFCLGKTSLPIPGAVTPSSSPIFPLQGRKMVSCGKYSQFMTKVEAGAIDRKVEREAQGDSNGQWKYSELIAVVMHISVG